jgi:hypothetical protein
LRGPYRPFPCLLAWGWHLESLLKTFTCRTKVNDQWHIAVPWSAKVRSEIGRKSQVKALEWSINLITP